MIVGAFLNDAGGEDAGRAYIFFGGSSPDSVADIVLTGQAADDQFGTSVSTAGDVNGDGYDDVIVGAYHNDGGGTNAGRAYIYYGGTSMDTLPDVVLTGEVVLPDEITGDQFGIRVAWAGDVNGDAYDDVIVGADGADVGSADNAGKAYLFFGGPNMAGRNASLADVVLQGEEIQDGIFASVNGAGDLNNDGYSDIVVGAAGYTTGSGSEDCRNFDDDDGDLREDRKDTDCYLGRAYIFLGGTALMDLTAPLSAGNANFTLSRPTEADGFGFSVASAGDVNGDSFSDLLIGAFLSDRVDLNNGKEICDNFDVNNKPKDDDGDGLSNFDDPSCLIIDQGRAYLYLGSINFNTSPDVTFLGQALAIDFNQKDSVLPVSGQFGFAVSGAGSLDGDQLSDIVIGAYLFDRVVTLPPFIFTDVGTVYTFLGTALTALVIPSTLQADTAASPIISGSDNIDNGFGISVQ
jgi:hypothetical protein